jgi:hypothetical protein
MAAGTLALRAMVLERRTGDGVLKSILWTLEGGFVSDGNCGGAKLPTADNL